MSYRSLTDQLAAPQANITTQNLVAIFRNPYDVIFAVPNRVTAAFVRFHTAILHGNRHNPMPPKGVGFPDPLSGTLKSNLHGTISRRTLKERVLQWTGAVENEERSYSRGRCFYFNSVRNPFEYYASLYNYGCDGRGGVAQAIRRHVNDKFYNRTEASFLKLTEFILDERKAELWHGEYSETCAHSIGLLTYRFLRLSLADPLQKLKLIKSPEETVQVFWRHSILNYTIRTESLNKELHYFFHGPLRLYVDINRSEALLVRNRKVNASILGVVTGETLRNSSLAQKVAERDAFILDTFYQKS